MTVPTATFFYMYLCFMLCAGDKDATRMPGKQLMRRFVRSTDSTQGLPVLTTMGEEAWEEASSKVQEGRQFVESDGHDSFVSVQPVPAQETKSVSREVTRTDSLQRAAVLSTRGENTPSNMQGGSQLAPQYFAHPSQIFSIDPWKNPVDSPVPENRPFDSPSGSRDNPSSGSQQNMYLSKDIMKRSSRSTSGSTGLRAIPVLAFGITWDPLGFVPRLMKSINYPVQRIIVVIGNDDPQILESLDRSIETTVQEHPEFLQGHVFVYRLPFNPGCARGENAGLRAMMSTTDVKWALIVNSDVIFNDNSLKSIYHHVEQSTDRNHGVITFNLGWSAWVMFRSAVEAVGLVDENMWPAYFEDNDMIYRLKNAGLGIASFPEARLGHADQQHVTRYVSGVALTLNNMNGSQPGKETLQAVIARTWDLNGEYLRQKWCHTCQGHGTFTSPWNNPNLPLWEWKFEPQRYDYYHGGEGNWTVISEVLDAARKERQLHGSSLYNYPLRLEDWIKAEKAEAKYY